MAQRNFKGVQISIPSELVKEAEEKFPDAESIKGLTRRIYGAQDSLNIYYNSLEKEVVDFLYERLKEMGERGAAGAITALRNAEKDPLNSSVANLKVLAKVIEQYVSQNSIDGWLYHRTSEGVLKAYLVTYVEYTEAERDCPASVSVGLVANVAKFDTDRQRSGMSNSTIHFGGESIGKRKVSDILASVGYIKETPELKAEYEASMELFSKYLPMHNQQFLAQGVAKEVTERNWGSRINIKGPVRCVNDEGLLRRTFTQRVDSPFWENQKKEFAEVPTHPEVLMFNLETHTNMWVHVDGLAPYVYDSTLRDKLVLPQDHRDLIDILTQDMDVLLDDIVAGKSGGTTVLCKGGPGLGKTLTAEVYSEVVERPLYKVHSGQLGVHSGDVQKNLEIVLKRAERWGAVMLIDEADVYIRKRGNDIDHNAVVASFLRTLEYFHGLLFMTTNRSDDVDDAIMSRCIATISYHTPTYDDAVRIWSVLSAQFNMGLSPSLIAGLAEHFNQCSGRDIKELLKLVSKWTRQKSVPATLSVFKQCAQFRGF